MQIQSTDIFCKKCLTHGPEKTYNHKLDCCSKCEELHAMSKFGIS